MQKSLSNKEKVLVVDDEASIRRILDTRLSMIGYLVITASDGEEALSLFRQENPNLVILDVMMPKLDGYGVCQEIRKNSDIPIIMLTALGGKTSFGKLLTAKFKFLTALAVKSYHFDNFCNKTQ